MFNTLLQRRYCVALNRFFPVLKSSCSSSAVVNKEPKIKSLVEEDFSRTHKTEFKEHFVENLFLNKLEVKVLEYPQLDSIEEVDIIKRHQDVAQKLITGKTDEENAACENDSKTAVSTLKRHELTGFKVPRLKNGFGYLNSEYTYMQEVLGLNPSLSKTISEQEDFGIYLINNFGNDAQKEQYLLKLTSGEKIVCFANIEKETLVSSVPNNTYKTSAVLSSDNQSYVISGTKCWVYNANSADLFIVSANVIADGEKQAKPTLFLIDRNTSGVEIHEEIETVGLKTLSISDVTFNNVLVPASSILGDVSQGGIIIKNALSKGKLNNGGHCLGLMRKLLDKAIQHCIHNDFFDQTKYETDYYKIKVGNMASRMYAVESATYLLTGRLDKHENADVFLESLIVKIFASETLQFFVQQVLEILGQEFFLSDDNLAELARDSQFYLACDDSNNYLRLILAYTGLNYLMEYQKQRSFFQFLSDTVSINDLLRFLLGEADSMSCQGLAAQYLHNMFRLESLMFEDSVAKLCNSTKFVINKYKNDAFDRNLELRYLADMLINVYAMAATLGRASRAYCICVKLSEIDRICTEAEIRRIALRVREMNRLIREPKKLPKYGEIAASVLNSNSNSYLSPMVKKLAAQ